MARQCLFCTNPANSGEHLWSGWILKDLKLVNPIHIKRGKNFSKWIDKTEVEMKWVCAKDCNGGWMSDIETENQPHMLAMMNDRPTILEPHEQKLLARWAILKAMVLDGSRRYERFYNESERFAMKPPLRALPISTVVWIGRLSIKAFHAGLTDSFGQINGIPKAFRNCIVTIIVGHLVIQVVTMHVLAPFVTSRLPLQYKAGEWDVNLLEIWPVFGAKSWPPAFSFVPKGRTPHHIAGLINRWKVGDDITR